MTYRVLPLLLVALALIAFVGAPALAEDKNNETHEGKIVSTSADKLIMTDKDGKEHTHTLAANGKVMLDGRAAKLEDLKTGQRVRVTTPKNDLKTAVKIEALDKNTDFSK